MSNHSEIKVKYYFHVILLISICLFLMNCSKNYYKKIDISYFKNGENTYKFKDFIYQGILTKDGLPVGKGKITYNNGTTASGYFSNGNLEDNNANFYIPGKGTIKGKCTKGVLIYGTIKYNSGDLYTGDIGNYDPNGKGEYRKKNLIMVGNFKNGLLEGAGAVIDTNTKTKTYSDYRKGIANGMSGIEGKDGNIRYVHFENGVDVTAEKKESYINNYVKSIESKELKPQLDSIKKLKDDLTWINEELEKSKSNYKSAESACAPRSGYLTVSPRPREGEYEYKWSNGFGTSYDQIPDDLSYDEQQRIWYGYTDDYEEREIEKEISFIGPAGMTRSEIRRLLLAEKAAIKERMARKAKLNELCEKWRSNPELYKKEIEEFLNKDYYLYSGALEYSNNLLKELSKTVQNRKLEQKRLEWERRNEADKSYTKLCKDNVAEFKRNGCLIRPCLFCPPLNATVTCQ